MCTCVAYIYNLVVWYSGFCTRHSFFHNVSEISFAPYHVTGWCKTSPSVASPFVQLLSNPALIRLYSAIYNIYLIYHIGTRTIFFNDKYFGSIILKQVSDEINPGALEYFFLWWRAPLQMLQTPRSRCYRRPAALKAYCATLWRRSSFFCFSK
jgi:hypothetical protein